MSAIDENTIVAWLKKALEELFRVDRDLLEDGAREETFGSRLAWHLARKIEPEFRTGDGIVEAAVLPRYRVDVEYFYDGMSMKHIEIAKGFILDLSQVRPDIVVHKRGPNVANLLAIEVKRRNLEDRFSQPAPLLALFPFFARRESV